MSDFAYISTTEDDPVNEVVLDGRWMMQQLQGGGTVRGAIERDRISGDSDYSMQFDV